jgi:hypothetical protein
MSTLSNTGTDVYFQLLIQNFFTQSITIPVFSAIFLVKKPFFLVRKTNFRTKQTTNTSLLQGVAHF